MKNRIFISFICFLICLYGGSQELSWQQKCKEWNNPWAEYVEKDYKVLISDTFEMATEGGNKCVCQVISTDGDDSNFEIIRIISRVEWFKTFRPNGERKHGYQVEEKRVNISYLESVWESVGDVFGDDHMDSVYYIVGDASFTKSPIYYKDTTDYDAASYKVYEKYHFRIAQKYFKYLSKELDGIIEVVQK